MNSMRKRKLTKNYTNFLTEGAGINEVKTMKTETQDELLIY